MEVTAIGFPSFGGIELWREELIVQLFFATLFIELWREEVIVQLYFAGQGFQSCPTLTVNQPSEWM